jgi:deltex-like protein
MPACINDLRKTFVNCLRYANDQLEVSSIAIPAISSGIYGVDINIVARLSYEALMEFDSYLCSCPTVPKKVKDVHFINNDTGKTRAMERVQRSLSNQKYSAGGCLLDDSAASPVNGYPTAPHQPSVSAATVGRQNSTGEASGHAGCSKDFHGCTPQPASYQEKCQQAGSIVVETSGLCNGGKQHNQLDAPGNVDSPTSHKCSSVDPPALSDQRDPDAGAVGNSAGSSAAGADKGVVRPKNRGLKKDDCVICMDAMQDPLKLDCGHSFCGNCIADYFEKGQPKCPSCGQLFGVLRGNQPDGTFSKYRNGNMHLAGYEKDGTIQITYSFPGGIQTDEHPHPGKFYKGTTRSAYLPDSPEGREVCDLLERAFKERLLFTIGRSITTGQDDVIVWNDIHQKTKPTGEHGYPDATYLDRVKAELAAKGIVSGKPLELPKVPGRNKGKKK